MFGYRYEDDNVHDYFFLDRRGGFGHLRFDQDNPSDARAAVRAMAQTPPVGESFERLFGDQLATIRRGVEEQLDE